MATTVPIPLPRPDNTTLGVDVGSGGFLNDLGSWLDGTVGSILSTAQGVAGNWFDFLTTKSQIEAQSAQAQNQAQQLAFLQSLQTGQGTTQIPFGTTSLGFSQASASALPAWLLPVGLVLVAGFALVLISKK